MLGMTDEDRRRLKGNGSGGLEPLGVRPVAAGRLIGESRNTVYRLLAAGKLRAVKRGTSTLVLMDSIHEYWASLPPASFGADRADARRT
jgi:excisionase family DNA binding protein